MTFDILLIGFFVMMLAGLVKGVVGMGLPAVGIGLLSLVMPPPMAAAIMVVPAFVTNLWQFFLGPRPAATARRFGPMMAMVIFGTLLGGFGLGGLSSPLALPLIGAVLVLYGLLGLLAVPLTVPPRWEGVLSPAMGLVTGIITGMTGVSVLPSAPYFKGLGLDRETFVEALGLTFLVATATLAVTLAAPVAASAPLTRPAVMAASAAALVPAFLGMALGRRLRFAASPATFARLLFAGLGLLGAYMVARGLLFRH